MRLLSLLRCFPDAKSDEIPPEVDLSIYANFDGHDINVPDAEGDAHNHRDRERDRDQDEDDNEENGQHRMLL